MNVVLLTGLFFFLQTFLGTALIMLGLDKHYTLNKLIDREGSVQTTFYVVVAFSVLFPAMIYGFLRLLRVEPKRDYAKYLTKKTLYRPKTVLFYVVAATAAVCLVLLGLLFREIGYIPILKLFFHDAAFDSAVERARIGGIYVLNPYVTNIGILFAIPALAYFSFACALSCKEKKWYVLAFILMVAAGLVKTYDFSKSPLIPFLLTYFCILIFCFGGIKFRWVLGLGGAGLLILIAAYSLQGTILDFTDIYNGIWGRTLFTQVGTLSFNFDLFPRAFSFLKGRSLSVILIRLLGLPYDSQLRSARLLMEFYGSSGVYDGTAGVMNSLFVGEAYANFGWAGLAISGVWVAFLIAAIYAMAMRWEKTPATITLFAFFTVTFATTTQGGFVDFVYNAVWLLMFVALWICHRFFFVKDETNEPDLDDRGKAICQNGEQSNL